MEYSVKLRVNSLCFLGSFVSYSFCYVLMNGSWHAQGVPNRVDRSMVGYRRERSRANENWPTFWQANIRIFLASRAKNCFNYLWTIIVNMLSEYI